MSRVLRRHLLPVLGGLAVLVAAAVPAPAWAGDSLPQLPTTVSGNCVDASPGTVTDKPWAQRVLLPERVWSFSTGAGAVVAVLDSGVHADGQLAGAVIGSGDDCAGHGTFVASLIAARPSAHTGFVGLAPAATVLSIPTTAATAAAGITAALAQHATVICLSTVVSQDSPALQDAVAQAARLGVPIVTPAFGDTGNPLPVTVLQRMAGVLTVAGVDPDGKDVTRPPAGAVIDVYAPGKAIVGLGPRGGQLVGAGAGVATGFVAATLALVRQYRPDLTPADLKQRLETTGYQQDTVTTASTVDPLAAVTATAGTRTGVAGPQYVAVPPAPAGPAGRETALTVLAVSVAVTLVAAGAGAVGRRASRRRWRPAADQRRAPAGDHGRTTTSEHRPAPESGPAGRPSRSAPGTPGGGRSAGPDRPATGAA